MSYLPRRGVCARALAAAVLAALDADRLARVRLAALAARGLVCLLFFAISFTSIPRSGFACRARKVVSYWLPHHWVVTCSTPFENARPGKAGRSVCTGRSGSEGSDITAPDDCRPGPF